MRCEQKDLIYFASSSNFSYAAVKKYSWRKIPWENLSQLNREMKISIFRTFLCCYSRLSDALVSGAKVLWVKNRFPHLWVTAKIGLLSNLVLLSLINVQSNQLIALNNFPFAIQLADESLKNFTGFLALKIKLESDKSKLEKVKRNPSGAIDLNILFRIILTHVNVDKGH